MLTTIQKIILTCLLGPENKKAWRQEQMRLWSQNDRKFNPEKRAAIHKKHRLKDLAGYRAYHAKWNREDRIVNPEKCRAFANEYYHMNSEKIIERVQKSAFSRRDKINLLKAERGCYDCGGFFPPESLDWDHLPGTVKSFNIGSSLSRSLEEVIEEINKCQLVCSNCHRVRTTKRKKERKGR